MYSEILMNVKSVFPTFIASNSTFDSAVSMLSSGFDGLVVGFYSSVKPSQLISRKEVSGLFGNDHSALFQSALSNFRAESPRPVISRIDEGVWLATLDKTTFASNSASMLMLLPSFYQMAGMEILGHWHESDALYISIPRSNMVIIGTDIKSVYKWSLNFWGSSCGFQGSLNVYHALGQQSETEGKSTGVVLTQKNYISGAHQSNFMISH